MKIFKDSGTFIEIVEDSSKACRVRLCDPPLIADDPVGYAPGQYIILSSAGTRRLYDALQAFYDPKAEPSAEAGQ